MIIPDGFAQVNYRFTGAGVPTGAECTIGLDLASTSVDPDVLGDTAAGWVDDAGIAAVMSIHVTLSSVLVKFGPNETGPSAVSAADLDGTYSSSDVTPASSYLIHKNTAFGGRAGRGRMYWPGAVLQEADVTGTFAGTFLTAMGTAFGALYTQITGDGFVPVLLHGEGSQLTTPTPLISITADSKIATQRRRLRR